MRRRTTTEWGVAALVLAALGLGAYLLFLGRQPPPTSPAQEAVPPAQVPGAPVAPASPEPVPTPGGSEPEGAPGTTLPPLAESDAAVRELARGLSWDRTARVVEAALEKSCRERGRAWVSI